ncbi:MAG: hypothetical protein H6711_12810 [Myxococcales bacterium]|nr:hypothetical protein [Myxococcales bacterium]
MQKLGAYLLERRDGMQTADARSAESIRICGIIENWLRTKGASDIASGGGTYDAVDHSDARFEVVRAGDGGRTWTLYRLIEVTPDGRRFDASLSVTAGATSIAVYTTLGVGTASDLINQVEVDPRCPKVIRTLLEDGDSWYHGASRLRGLTHVVGFEAGEALALDIKHEQRSVPVVVLSKMHDALAIAGLDEKLAYDLAGTANVFTVDEAASWALTDTLRKPLSCYAGAVRLYWPGCHLNDNPYRHPLWTAARLHSLDPDEHRARERFRRRLRQLILRAAAVSVTRPREIDEIRNAAARAEFAEAKGKAKSTTDFEALADLFAKENDELRLELLERDEQIAELQAKVARLESERKGLMYHLRQARPDTIAVEDDDDVGPDLGEDATADQGPPEPGEVRFYKKRFSAPTHDIMVLVGDCGHNSWQGANKADKAKNGIEKFEGTRAWRLLQHCGRCTGGGRWRVEW